MTAVLSRMHDRSASHSLPISSRTTSMRMDHGPEMISWANWSSSELSAACQCEGSIAKTVFNLVKSSCELCGRLARVGYSSEHIGITFSAASATRRSFSALTIAEAKPCQVVVPDAAT